MLRQPRWLKQLGNTPNGVFAVDADQCIVTWNRAAEKIFGRPTAETVGRHCYEVIDGRLRSGKRFCRENCRVHQCVGRGAIVDSFDLLTTTNGGDDVWINVSVTGLETSNGPIGLHTVRRAEQRERSEDALQEILSTLKTYGLAKRHGEADNDIQVCCEPDEQPGNLLGTLTRRELEVLGLLTRGYSTEDVSRELHVSVYTTRCHVRNMLKKTKLHNRTELVSLALRNARAGNHS